MPQARSVIVGLLQQRGVGKTICPSEAARVLAEADGDWRERMMEVHEAVDALVSEQAISLSWKGEAMTKREGPYRIAQSKP